MMNFWLRKTYSTGNLAFQPQKMSSAVSLLFIGTLGNVQVLMVHQVMLLLSNTDKSSIKGLKLGWPWHSCTDLFADM